MQALDRSGTHAVDAGCKLDGKCGLPLLGGLPGSVVNDAQFWNVFDDPFRFRVDAGHAPAAVRVLNVAQSVPNELSDIQLVVHNSGAARRVSADRRIDPYAAVRTRDGFGVQVVGNAPRGLARCELAKDAADNLRFRVIDFPFTVDRGTISVIKFHNVVPVAESPTSFPGLNAAAQT